MIPTRVTLEVHKMKHPGFGNRVLKNNNLNCLCISIKQYAQSFYYVQTTTLVRITKRRVENRNNKQESIQKTETTELLPLSPDILIQP